MDVQPQLEFLNGFLKAIEIAVARRSRISANWYSSNGDPVVGLGALYQERGIAFGRLEGVRVSRDEFLSRVWSFSTDLLEGAPAAVLEDFKWQFEECLGLISTSIDPDGPFHPLLHCPLHSVVVEREASETVLSISFDQLVVALFCESRA